MPVTIGRIFKTIAKTIKQRKILMQKTKTYRPPKTKLFVTSAYGNTKNLKPGLNFITAQPNANFETY
jgi:hypothetical protein